MIFGDPKRQYKIVGNSVDRRVASAIGVHLREAWVASHKKFANTDFWRRTVVAGKAAISMHGETAGVTAYSATERKANKFTKKTRYGIRRGTTIIVADSDDGDSSDSDVNFGWSIYSTNTAELAAGIDHETERRSAQG